MTAEMRKDLIEIYNHFGEIDQQNKLQEECFELMWAIEMFNESPTDDNCECMIDEMADVFSVVYQHYLVNPKVRNRVNFKINRTKERIQAGYYERNN